MAKSKLVPAKGSVSIDGFAGVDFNSIEVESRQAVEDTTPFGSNGMGENTGNGTPTMRVTCGGFATKGVAESSPGLTNVGAFDALGIDATLQFDVGCTLTGKFVQESTRITEQRMRAAVPLVMTLANASDIVEAWDAGGGSSS